jgi:glucose/arabinose dehydrogenase
MSDGEQGLLGLAFHPQFPRVNKFYVNYTNNAGTPRPPLRTIIASFTVDTSTLIADFASREEIMSFSQPFTNHNGGKVEFGPDSMLYISAGDGGSANDPQNNAQRKVNLLGKILRIDVNRRDPGLAYAIPRDNPFVDSAATVRKEIYAYGLRNVWRFSWDWPTNRLWAGDVGQNAWEEVDTIVSGGNYGWKIREGYTCISSAANCLKPFLKPLWVYPHTANNLSITGGIVYRGTQVPYLVGKYIYADYVSGRIWSLEQVGDTLMRNTEIIDLPSNVSSFGRDEDGEIYVLNYATGAIQKIQASPTAVKQGFGQNGTLRIYPNPIKTEFSVEVDVPMATQATITLHDLTGETIRTIASSLKLPTGKSTFTVRTQGLPAGTYFVRVEGEKDVIARRIVITK